MHYVLGLKVWERQKDQKMGMANPMEKANKMDGDKPNQIRSDQSVLSQGKKHHSYFEEIRDVGLQVHGYFGCKLEEVEGLNFRLRLD